MSKTRCLSETRSEGCVLSPWWVSGSDSSTTSPLSSYRISQAGASEKQDDDEQVEEVSRLTNEPGDEDTISERGD